MTWTYISNFHSDPLSVLQRHVALSGVEDDEVDGFVAWAAKEGLTPEALLATGAAVFEAVDAYLAGDAGKWLRRHRRARPGRRPAARTGGAGPGGPAPAAAR